MLACSSLAYSKPSHTTLPCLCLSPAFQGPQVLGGTMKSPRLPLGLWAQPLVNPAGREIQTGARAGLAVRG